MPTWNTKEKHTLEINTKLLREAVMELCQQINEDPTFEEVTGVNTQTLVEQAKFAVTALVVTDPSRLEDPESWLKIFCLGFLAGKKYQELIARKGNNE